MLERQLRLAQDFQLIDEAAIVIEIGKVASAAQQNGLLKGAFEVSVRAFDRTVLMRDAKVVERRCHAVMCA